MKMKNILSKIKDKVKKWGFDDEPEGKAEEEYVELDTSKGRDKSSKIVVRPFVLEDFSDIKPILDTLREGYTIALINIRPLKEKDIVELKRAINKLKKTTDALDGDIAGFGDDYIVIAPSFAEIYRSSEVKETTTDDSVEQ